MSKALRFEPGAKVWIYLNERKKKLDHAIEGEIIEISKERPVKNIRVRFIAPWGTSSAWYSDYQLELIG